MYKILIAENLPAFNKGEMAIAQGILDVLSGIPHRLSILSYYAQFDRGRYKDEVNVVDVRSAWPRIINPSSGKSLFCSFDVFMRHLLFAVLYRFVGQKVLKIYRTELWRAYAEADVILFGHDSSFGVGGDPENPLFYPIYIPLISRIMGKPIMFFAGTVPLPPRRFHKLFGQLFRGSLLLSSSVTLREGGSLKNISKFGNIPANVQVTSDIAYLIKPDAVDRINEILANEGIDCSKPLIGITISRVRASVAHPGETPEKSYEKHINMMANAVDGIIRMTGANVIFLPHSIGMEGKGDDRLVSEDVKSLCVETEFVKCLMGEYNPKELKGIIKKCDVFVGERLHSVIGATSLGVPTIAISYLQDPRLGMVRPMVTDKYILHLENLTANQLQSAVEDLWLNRKNVSVSLQERSVEMCRLAAINGHILKQLLEKRSVQ